MCFTCNILAPNFEMSCSQAVARYSSLQLDTSSYYLHTSIYHELNTMNNELIVDLRIAAT